MDLVKMPGKKERRVPILITNDAKKAMNALVDCRELVDIPRNNPYFFASKSECGFLDSWQALNFVVQESSVQHPEHITSTKVRKYNATVCQVTILYLFSTLHES
jgi:hypothetical protein